LSDAKQEPTIFRFFAKFLALRALALDLFCDTFLCQDKKVSIVAEKRF
jgi:hypothetical protein